MVKCGIEVFTDFACERIFPLNTPCQCPKCLSPRKVSEIWACDGEEDGTSTLMRTRWKCKMLLYLNVRCFCTHGKQCVEGDTEEVRRASEKSKVLEAASWNVWYFH